MRDWIRASWNVEKGGCERGWRKKITVARVIGLVNVRVDFLMKRSTVRETRNFEKTRRKKERRKGE